MGDQRETTSFLTSVLITISLTTLLPSQPPRKLSSTSSKFQRPPRLRILEFLQSTNLHTLKNSIPMSLPPSRTRRPPLPPSDKSGPSNGQYDHGFECATLIILRNELNKQTLAS